MSTAMSTTTTTTTDTTTAMSTTTTTAMSTTTTTAMSTTTAAQYWAAPAHVDRIKSGSSSWGIYIVQG